MSSEWPFVQLGELTVNLDTRRKPVKEADRKSGPYPYYGASGIVDYVDGFIFEGEHLLIAEDGENLRTRQTPIAFMASGKFWVNNHAHIVLGNEKASTRFLQYALLATDISGYLTGAVMPKLTQGNLNRIEVPCPPRDLQEQIVSVLGALDDRITLLRETNSTLEAIAQALFKSWFVDFDPVRAKMEGRVPEGMDEATAALFPSSFEETELGEVPRGWRPGCLGDVAKTFKKAVTPSDLHAGINYVGLEHIPRKSLSLIEWSDAAELESNKAFFNEGDILFGKLRPYFHKVVVAPTSGVCSTDILVCQPTQAEHRGLATMHLFSDTLISYADRLSNGAKMPRVNWSDLAKFPISVPSLEISSSYTNAIEPLVSRMSHNMHAARTLVTIRDTLLPRLIAGQIRLPEAQAQLEEALL